MASIKNSLRKIYTALSGTGSKSKTITGLLDDISTVASGGSGGGGIEIVNVALQGYGSDSTVKSMDKTRDELVSAHNDGKLIVARMSIEVGGSGGVIPVSLILCYADYVGGAFTSGGITNLYDGIYYVSLAILPNSNNLDFSSISSK